MPAPLLFNVQEFEQMPEQKNNDNPIPGGNPPAPDPIDPAAQKAVDKAEKEFVERAGDQVVPNVPGIGIAESAAVGNQQPAGTARPSVDVPTFAPPEQAGKQIGVDVQALKMQTGKNADRALKAEQKIAWFIQHQPTPVPGGITALQGLHNRLHAARYSDQPIDESLIDAAEAAIGPLNIPDFGK